MTKYNKSEIMSNAWEIFKNTEYAEKVLEVEAVESFSEALKEAWKIEKAYVESKNISDDDESVKAWNWAAKKMNVNFEIDNATKAWNVDNMLKETWNGSVWSAAMKAVKLEIKLAA